MLGSAAASMPTPSWTQRPRSRVGWHERDEHAEKYRSDLCKHSRGKYYLEQLLLAQFDQLFKSADSFNGTIADIGDVVGGATLSKKDLNITAVMVLGG